MCAVDDLVKEALDMSYRANEVIRMNFRNGLTEDVPIAPPDFWSSIPSSVLSSGAMWLMNAESNENIKIIKMEAGSRSLIHAHPFVEAFLAFSGSLTYIIYLDEISEVIMAKGTLRFGDAPIRIEKGCHHVMLTTDEITYAALRITDG